MFSPKPTMIPNNLKLPILMHIYTQLPPSDEQENDNDDMKTHHHPLFTLIVYSNGNRKRNSFYVFFNDKSVLSHNHNKAFLFHDSSDPSIHPFIFLHIYSFIQTSLFVDRLPSPHLIHISMICAF